MKLSWTKVTDETSLIGYRLYDGATLLDFVTGLSAIRTGLPNGVAKTTFGLTAVDSSGNESAKTLFPSFTPPRRPRTRSCQPRAHSS